MASSVVEDFEASERMTISGLLSGSVIVRHSGSQSMSTQARVQRKRRTSSEPVRFFRVARLIATKHKKPITHSATIPTQNASGVGENVRFEIEKFNAE